MNTNNQNLILGIVVGAALLASSVISSVWLNSVDREISLANAKIVELEMEIQKVKDVRVGAITGPDMNFTTMTFNGVKKHFWSGNFNTGTTVLCRIPVPSNVPGSIASTSASTTVVSLGARFDTIATTSGVARWFKGLTRNATTTALTDGQIISATGTILYATTTDLGTAAASEVGKGQWITLDFQGGSTPFFAVDGKTGSCFAEFQGF